MAQKRFKRAVFKEIFFIATHLSKARRMIKRTDKYTSEDRAQFAREIMSRMRKAAKTHSLVYGLDNLRPLKPGQLIWMYVSTAINISFIPVKLPAGKEFRVCRKTVWNACWRQQKSIRSAFGQYLRRRQRWMIYRAEHC